MDHSVPSSPATHVHTYIGRYRMRRRRRQCGKFAAMCHAMDVLLHTALVAWMEEELKRKSERASIHPSIRHPPSSSSSSSSCTTTTTTSDVPQASSRPAKKQGRKEGRKIPVRHSVSLSVVFGASSFVRSFITRYIHTYLVFSYSTLNLFTSFFLRSEVRLCCATVMSLSLLFLPNAVCG